MPSAVPHLLLDLSRLLSRTLHATPTGVDRVEMAYARGLAEMAPGKVTFVALHPTGVYGRLPHRAALDFLDRTESAWEARNHPGTGAIWLQAARTFASLRPQLRWTTQPGAIYVQSSPHHLTQASSVARILKRERARFVCLVHDLIPLEHPEFARADGAELHRRRIETITAHADGIVANSAATAASLLPWIERSGRSPILRVAHLGSLDRREPDAPPSRATPNRPYFVCVGTIEPRKNHLLLLNLWKRMAETRGAEAIPKLAIVGRRGWENEQVVDMLERCPALRGCVEEHNGLADRDVRSLMRHARALLLPSFAEGYGMPVSEALDLGVPVLCSDLPALREVGDDVPDFLDPLDGPAWLRAIDAYCEDGPARSAQLDRITRWRRPEWRDHFKTVFEVIEGLPT